MSTADHHATDHERATDASHDRGQPSMLQALGGRRMLDSGLPGLAFGLVYTQGGGDLRTSALAALAIGAVLLVVRLVRRESVASTLIGFAGVALAAGVAGLTTRPEAYFVPGMVINGALALVLLVSILARRPLLGYPLAAFSGDRCGDRQWLADRARMRAYTWATWVWFALYALRLVGKLPFYLSGEVGKLAIANVILGWPLLLATIGATYLSIRRLPATGQPDVATTVRSAQHEARR